MEKFRRCEKLKKKKDFDSVFQNKSSCFRRTSNYNFIYKQNSFGFLRIGIVAKKNIGCAVVRNHEKRLVREFFRRMENELKSLSYDFVCIIKKSSSSDDKKALDFENFVKSLQGVRQ